MTPYGKNKRLGKKITINPVLIQEGTELTGTNSSGGVTVFRNYSTWNRFRKYWRCWKLKNHNCFQWKRSCVILEWGGFFFLLSFLCSILNLIRILLSRFRRQFKYLFELFVANSEIFRSLLLRWWIFSSRFTIEKKNLFI